MNTDCIAVRRALLSVSDKTGIVEFATELANLGIEILSTGGTAKLLQEQRIPVIEVSEYTQFPEMMDGRVKTLHPKIHAGLLARINVDEAVLAEHQIPMIDLVVVNLYPFQKVIANADCTLEHAIENIDIGGPTMLRAAAKNYQRVTVVVDSNDYQTLLQQLQNNKSCIDSTTRFQLAKKVFQHTARYDAAIANYLTAQAGSDENEFPDNYTLTLHKKQSLRYGENPHQQAAFYCQSNPAAGSIAFAKQLQGKELSYNNIADADAAWECVQEFTDLPACVIVKHANPCGVAVAASQEQAYQRAYATDPTSSFGGIIAFNSELTADCAKKITEQQFVEVIIAPAVSAEAIAILKQKNNLRVLICGASNYKSSKEYDYKRVSGGLLIQTHDSAAINTDKLQLVTKRKPSDNEVADLLFAWRIVKHVKSNAIVYAKDNATIGIGAGQMSRVYSSKIAIIKANDEGLAIAGSVMASDAFFPFRDSIDSAAEAGVCAIIQPGGSIRDEEVIQAADEANIAMVFTGIRHFKH